MTMKIRIEDLADEVTEALQEYGATVTEEMKDAIFASGETVKSSIQSHAPKDTGAYAKSWAIKVTGATPHGLSITVYSRNRYQLTHLLEFGHAKRGGGRVKAQPHIADAERDGQQELEKQLRRRLGDG